MDHESALLASINAKLQETIEKMRQAKLEEMRARAGLPMLFDMGCGFTEFLSNVFAHLPLPQVLQCRLVCSTWRDFIDTEVVERHPDTVSERLWRTGVEAHSMLYCGGEVATIASDASRVYAAMRHGEVLVFNGCTFLLETVLEGRKEPVWQVGAGLHIVAAVTESCVTVWRKPGGSDDNDGKKKKKKPAQPSDWRTSNLNINEAVPWEVVARVRHGSQGEPFLHVEMDALSIPGDSKHVCRVLVYKEESRTLTGVRDFPHGRHWVLGSQLELPNLLTLSLLAWGSATERELRLWNVMDGSCLVTLLMPGGVAGFPALRYPHAFLSTHGKGLEVWDLRTSTRLRTVPGPVLGYQICGQLLFLLSSHCKAKVVRLGELVADTPSTSTLWSRELEWLVDGPMTGSLPRLQVDGGRLMAVASTGRARDLLHVLTMVNCDDQ